jgi:hypothetical protein
MYHALVLPLNVQGLSTLINCSVLATSIYIYITVHVTCYFWDSTLLLVLKGKTHVVDVFLFGFVMVVVESMTRSCTYVVLWQCSHVDPKG